MQFVLSPFSFSFRHLSTKVSGKAIKRINPKKFPPKKAFKNMSDQIPSEYNHSSEIELLSNEQSLFALLKHVSEVLGNNTVVRAAGGWVRDKYLGLHSHDIDIALDNMSGLEFAQAVNEFLSTHGGQTRRIGVIRANPNKSKHLETAAAKIMDLEIDFVNLRNETYTDDSRIPEMVFGTPEEDAFRRDLTINSLFFNINSGQVEDLTNRGIEDLRGGIIRTPLTPLRTFLDDPLRVLRSIRFATRLNFRLDPELIIAARSDEVKDALLRKVSRERYGIEVSKMLSVTSANDSIKLFYELGLMPIIFKLPDTYSGEIEAVSCASDCWQVSYFASQSLHSFLEQLKGRIPSQETPESKTEQPASIPINSTDTIQVLNFAAVLLPFRFCTTTRKPISVSEIVIVESIKLGRGVAKPVTSIISTCGAFAQFFQGESLTRQSLGLAVREAKELWQQSLVMGAILSRLHQADKESDLLIQEDLVEQFIEIRNRVFEYGLEGVWTMKPLIQIPDLVKEFSLRGNSIKIVVDECIRWQLVNPECTEEELLAYITPWIQENIS